ncbi:PaaI family thioesterase [Variovorax ureilyticus]|uniref:PaaI family thioesterase n=1 Tax=Variovorax ureilyticus TaxID=1836198 RepID=UPI003D670A0A
MAATLGIRAVSMESDRVVLKMSLSPAQSNHRGSVSGGALATLLDLGLAAAVRADAPTRYSVATVELSLRFLRPCIGDVSVVAHCERRGRSISFARGEAIDQEGRAVASATGVFCRLPRAPHEP